MPEEYADEKKFVVLQGETYGNFFARTAQVATYETIWSPRHGRFHTFPGGVHIYIAGRVLPTLRKELVDYLRTI